MAPLSMDDVGPDPSLPTAFEESLLPAALVGIPTVSVTTTEYPAEVTQVVVTTDNVEVVSSGKSVEVIEEVDIVVLVAVKIVVGSSGPADVDDGWASLGHIPSLQGSIAQQPTKGPLLHR